MIKEAVNGLVSLIKTRTPWTDYIDNIVCIVSINRDNNGQSMSVFEYTAYPFRVADIALPECNNGFIYMLMIIKDTLFVYIEETKYIRTRITNHNSGHGSSMTTPFQLRPYAVVAYMCGFDGNNILCHHIE